VARTNEDALELIRVLEDRPEFDGVPPMNSSVNEQGIIEFRLTMKYTPPSAPPVMAAANADPRRRLPRRRPPRALRRRPASASPSPAPSPAVSAVPSPLRLGRASEKPQ
jgi:hypothetical protein